MNFDILFSKSEWRMNDGTPDSACARDQIDPDFTRDILESDIPRDVLEILLTDRTTGKNIMWMTDGYEHLESVFDTKMRAQDEIDIDVISRPGNKIIRPRVDKSKAEQKERIQKKAAIGRLFDGWDFGIVLSIERMTMRGKSTDSALERDILEWNVPEEVFAVLLKGCSTGRNLIRATDDYAARGNGFGVNDEIQAVQIADKEHPVIRLRDIQAQDLWYECFELRTKGIE